MNPSCTRFRQKATCPFSDGGDAIEYARVISSPSGVLAFTESHCPGTNPKRGTPFTLSSRWLVNSESATERSRRASRVLKWAIILLDDDKRSWDANGSFLLHRHGLRQIARLIDVASAAHGDVI